MSWRLWKLLRGAFRPGPPLPDIAEARRSRLEAEFELRHAQARAEVVDEVVGRLHAGQETDVFADLIERTFARRGAQ